MLRTGSILAASLLFGGLLSATAAQAQSQSEFIEAFAGDWQVIDSRFAAADEPCRLSLTDEDKGEHLAVERRGCGGELELVETWGVAEGQMALFDEGESVLAMLGGNQRRMSGTSASGIPVIIERAGAAGMADVLESARRASGCFYAGFTDECVPEAELEMPEANGGRVDVLVNLNVRAEARAEASVVGIVPEDTCIATDICVEASDGAWCRARFDDNTGWMRKLALRQNRWPVVTFLNQCDEEE